MRVTKTPEEMIAELKASITDAEKAIKDLQKKVRFGVQPSGGSIIKFEKVFDRGGNKYTYAAIREGVFWYLSGGSYPSKRNYTWEDLKAFIGDGKAWIMTVKEQVPDGRVGQS